MKGKLETQYKQGWIFLDGWDGKNTHLKILPMSGICDHQFIALREGATSYREFLYALIREVETEMLKRGFHYIPELPRATMLGKEDRLKKTYNH